MTNTNTKTKADIEIESEVDQAAKALEHAYEHLRKASQLVEKHGGDQGKADNLYAYALRSMQASEKLKGYPNDL